MQKNIQLSMFKVIIDGNLKKNGNVWKFCLTKILRIVKLKFQIILSYYKMPTLIYHELQN